MEGLVKAFGLDWRIFLSEVVNFIVLLGIIFWVIKKYVNPILEKRRTIIADGVAKFEKAEETLASAVSEKDSILADANNQASETIAASVEKGKERESQILSEADTKAQNLLDQAKAKGEMEKEGIIASSKEEIAKMITLGAEKVLSAK